MNAWLANRGYTTSAVRARLRDGPRFGKAPGRCQCTSHSGRHHPVTSLSCAQACAGAQAPRCDDTYDSQTLARRAREHSSRRVALSLRFSWCRKLMPSWPERR